MPIRSNRAVVSSWRRSDSAVRARRRSSFALICARTAARSAASGGGTVERVERFRRGVPLLARGESREGALSGRGEATAGWVGVEWCEGGGVTYVSVEATLAGRLGGEPSPIPIPREDVASCARRASRAKRSLPGESRA